MPTIDLAIDRLPAAYRDHARQVPFATARALNDTAFKMKSDLEKRGADDLTFRRPVRQALGIGVEKATKATLTAQVGSTRGFLTHQVEDGTVTPVSGVVWKGRQYLLIPNAKTAALPSGARKRLRAGGGKVFVIQSRSGPILARRTGPRRDQIVLIGKLVPQANYANEFGWEDQSNDTVRIRFGAFWERAMDKAIASAR